MSDMTKTLSSPVWWISVVVAGILINLLSSYLRTLLDVRFSKLSKRWRERSEKQKRERENYVQSLLGQPHRQIVEFHRSTRLHILSVMCLVLGTFALGLSMAARAFGVPLIITSLIGFVSGLVFLVAIAFLFTAEHISLDIFEAIEREAREQKVL
jgi:hypothetical protein